MELPKRIWISKDKDSHDKWSSIKFQDDDIKYYRADRYHALLDTAVSLHHWLFELLDKEIVTPASCYPEGSDIREAIESAQLAIDKYNRFLNGD
jgi:hypothetical protein